MQCRSVREPTLHLVGGEVTKICPSIPQATSSQVESPEQRSRISGQKQPGTPWGAL